MPYEILLQHVSIVPCLCVFGISHFGLYYLYSSTKELHIRNGIYYILKEKKGKLTILYEGTAIYDEPVEAMSGILYYREGGAPYNEAYYFTRFEKDGTMVKGPTYQCYDSDEDGEIGVEDLYLKDGVEQDRTAWEKETEIYRAIKNERGL